MNCEEAEDESPTCPTCRAAPNAAMTRSRGPRAPGRTTSSEIPRRSSVVLLLPIRASFRVRPGRAIHARNGMLAFFRRPRTQRLREYERQLAVQVTVFAIATISETERHDLNRGRPREPIDGSSPRGVLPSVSLPLAAVFARLKFLRRPLQLHRCRAHSCSQHCAHQHTARRRRDSIKPWRQPA